MKTNPTLQISPDFEPVTPAFAYKLSGPSLNLGTKELRGHHSVMIEPGPGKVCRSRVMDQHIIDRYLMRGLLSLGQHRAGEFLLMQATRAGIWPTGVDLSVTSSASSVRNYVPFGAFPFGRTLVLVRRRYGDFHQYVVREVVCHGWDVSEDGYMLRCLQEGLDLIDALKLRGRGNPVRKLKEAVEKGHRSAPAVAS